MTKKEALDLLGVGVNGLAAMLEISHAAVSQWPDSKIPLAREYQIRDLAQGKQPLRNESLAKSA
jgi:predicted transcriptional regulator